MLVKDAVAERVMQLCQSRSIRINELANLAGLTPSTVYSLMDARRRNASITTIKKLCDGLEISLGEFFSAQVFDTLEQELQ